MSDNKKLQIIIIGGNFIGKGAEAMMFTVRDYIWSFVPDAEFWVIPLNHLEQEKLVRHRFNSLIPRGGFKAGSKRKEVLNAILRFFLPTKDFWIKCLFRRNNHKVRSRYNDCAQYDIVVDISGFKSGDQIGSKRAFMRWIDCYCDKYAGSKIIFMPQAWGPFNKYLVRLFTKLILRNAQMISAREKSSYDYLLQIPGIDEKKIFLSPDIAFNFHADTCEAGKMILSKAGLADVDAPIISICSNVRIYERLSEQGSKNSYLVELQKIVEYFIENTSCRVVLIPHETFPNSFNDVDICRLLKEQFAECDLVYTLSGDESAAEVKAVIGLSEFLVTSRYHALVAGLSKRVPVAVIGWSHKYNELMRDVGLAQWIVDPVRKGESAFEMVKYAWAQRQDIRKTIQKHVPLLEKQSLKALNEMIEIVKDVRANQ